MPSSSFSSASPSSEGNEHWEYLTSSVVAGPPRQIKVWEKREKRRGGEVSEEERERKKDEGKEEGGRIEREERGKEMGSRGRKQEGGGEEGEEEEVRGQEGGEDGIFSSLHVK